MQITYFDSANLSEKTVKKHQTNLNPYRELIQQVVEGGEQKRPEMALATWRDQVSLETVYRIKAELGKVKHVILVGIGGSSLGTEAVHSVLAHERSPELHVLDTLSAFELQAVLQRLRPVKKAEHIAICVISKSGTTTETLANAAVLTEALQKQFGKEVHQRCVFIGTAKSPLLAAGKKLGGRTIVTPEAIGGRYSVGTAAGLVPLALLGHDVEEFLNGLQDATREHYEETVAESAARLYTYLTKGIRAVNFFAFDTRLVRLGKWYRQLAAESLGKAKRTDGKSNKLGFVPVISTPVELHSVGQLYLSGFAGVYTDFVVFDDEIHDFTIPKTTKLASNIKGKSMQDIMVAIFGGVVGAYQKQELPYRATQFEEDATYSLGLFMGMRMLETMYVAHLIGVNAFDQPNVETYKEITREILAT